MSRGRSSSIRMTSRPNIPSIFINIIHFKRYSRSFHFDSPHSPLLPPLSLFTPLLLTGFHPTRREREREMDQNEQIQIEQILVEILPTRKIGKREEAESDRERERRRSSTWRSGEIASPPPPPPHLDLLVKRIEEEFSPSHSGLRPQQRRSLIIV